MMVDALGLALVGVGMVLNVGAQIALKFAVAGASDVSWSDPVSLLRLAFNPLVIFGLFLYAASVINWLVVLKRLDLGLAYPLMSVGYILTFLVGVWCFKEPVSATRIAGILVIIFGVVLLTRPVAAA
jgi:multidrug transporter EmrE-like cation transporter